MPHAKGQLSDNDALLPKEFQRIRNTWVQLGDQHHHWRVLFDVLWFTGIRISEALAIRRRDLVLAMNDRDVAAVMVHRLKKKVDRGDDQVPVPLALGTELDDLAGKDPSAVMFAKRNRRGDIVSQYEPLTQQAAWKALRRSARIAGVRVGRAGESSVRPHLYRHGLAQFIVDNPPPGLNEMQHRSLVTAVFAHSSEKMTERYYRRSNSQVQTDWREVQDMMLLDVASNTPGARVKREPPV